MLDSAIDALGDRLTVGSSWVLPSVRGDEPALLTPGQTAVSDAYRYDPYGVTLAASAAGVRPPAERNRDVALCSMGPEPGTAGAGAWSAACDRADADAAALTPDCGPLGTSRLKDLAGDVSAATGTVALGFTVAAMAGIETGPLDIVPASAAGLLEVVSLVTGSVSMLGTCSKAQDASCAMSVSATGLSAAGPFGAGLKVVGAFGGTYSSPRPPPTHGT